MNGTLQDSQVRQVERNPETEAIHRREVFWQITVPLVISGSIFVFFITWVIFAGAEANSQAADVALMWLLLVPMFVTLLFTILLGALVYGVWKLVDLLPGYLFLVQDFFCRVQVTVRTYADKSVEPFLKAHSASASSVAFWRSLFKKGS